MTNIRRQGEAQSPQPVTRVDVSGREPQPIRKPVTAPWDVPVSEADFRKMVGGFLPQAMEGQVDLLQ